MPFILNNEIGNGENQIYLIVSTHGLLANGPAQAEKFPTINRYYLQSDLVGHFKIRLCDLSHVINSISFRVMKLNNLIKCFSDIMYV